MLHLDQGGAALPSAEILVPPAGLAPFVEGAWLQYPVRRGRREVVADPAARGRRSGAGGWRIVAGPATHLIVTASGGARPSSSHGRGVESGHSPLRPREAERARAVVVGPRTRWLDVDPRDRAWTLVIRLRPGALPRLVHAPAIDFRDRSVRLAELFPRLGARLEARALETSPGSLLSELWTVLGERLRDAAEPDWRVVGLDPGLDPGRDPSSPGAAADRMGVPPRTLRAALREGAGISPGTLIRLRRLHRALLSGIRTGRRWSRVAAAAGFHDQAHLIRECRTFLGETPVDFVARGR